MQSEKKTQFRFMPDPPHAFCSKKISRINRMDNSTAPAVILSKSEILKPVVEQVLYHINTFIGIITRHQINFSKHFKGGEKSRGLQ